MGIVESSYAVTTSQVSELERSAHRVMMFNTWESAPFTLSPEETAAAAAAILAALGVADNSGGHGASELGSAFTWVLPDGSLTVDHYPAIAIVRLEKGRLYAKVYPDGSAPIRFHAAHTPEEAVAGFFALYNWALEEYATTLAQTKREGDAP